MPLTSSGKKVLGSMKDQYGEKKGESVFYATANKKPKLGAKWHGSGDSMHTAGAGGTGGQSALNGASATTKGVHHVSGTSVSKGGGGGVPGEGPLGGGGGSYLGGKGANRVSPTGSAGALPSAGYSKSAPGARPTSGVHHSSGTKTPQTPYASKSKIGHATGNKPVTSGGAPASPGASKMKSAAGASPPSRSKGQAAAFNDGGFKPVQGGGSPFGGERAQIASKYTRRVALSTGS